MIILCTVSRRSRKYTHLSPTRRSPVEEVVSDFSYLQSFQPVEPSRFRARPQASPTILVKLTQDIAQHHLTDISRPRGSPRPHQPLESSRCQLSSSSCIETCKRRTAFSKRPDWRDTKSYKKAPVYVLPQLVQETGIGRFARISWLRLAFCGNHCRQPCSALRGRVMSRRTKHTVPL